MNDQVKTILSWLGTGSINVFGRPFAGKDTQGRILADILGGDLIAGGDILRSYPDQEKIEKVMAAGGLIPSDFYLDIMLPFLSRPELKEKPLILSAVGRLKGEETIIMEATETSGHPIKAVVVLQLTNQDVWDRYEESKNQNDRGDRSDDKLETLKNRLQKFEDKTEPVIEFYRSQGLLIEVDGTKPREEVTNEIIDKLYERATN